MTKISEGLYIRFSKICHTPYTRKIFQLNLIRNQIGRFVKVGLACLCWHSVLVKVLRSKAYLIVPVHSKSVKSEVLEIILVLQLLAYPLVVQGGKIKSLDFPCVECKFQNIVRNILG